MMHQRGFTLIGMLLTASVLALLMSGIVGVYVVQDGVARQRATISVLKGIALAARDDCIIHNGVYASSYADLMTRRTDLPANNPFGFSFTLSGGRYRAIVQTQVPASMSIPAFQDGVFVIEQVPPAGSAIMQASIAWGVIDERTNAYDSINFTDNNSFPASRPWPW